MAEIFNGIVASRYLEFLSDRAPPHRKDNTDKLWSYKVRGGRRTEFAFDPKTKHGLYVWFDDEPPRIQGVSDIKDISRKSNRTALSRVFSGGAHIARFKATIASKEALLAVIGYFEGVSPAVELPDVDIPASGTEGAARLVSHLRRERDRALVEAKKAATLKTKGSLCCEACGFDFSVAYGTLGDGFCEIHHLVPLSASAESVTTTLDDLAVLCSNCHRIIHRSVPMLSVAELSKVVTHGSS